MAVITPRCAAYTAAVKARFPSARFDGIFSCRTIIPHNGGSSSTYSEHAWGNAVDFTGSANLQAQMVAFAQKNKGLFGINNIIPPGSAVNAVHVDFLPSHAGSVPPCAGGPHTKSPAARKGIASKVGTGTASASTSGGCSCAGWNAWNPLCRIGQGVCSVKEGVLGEFAVVGRWLEAGAGGAIMIVGLGVMIFGVTGRNAGPVVGAAIKATGPVGMAASSASSDPVGAQRTTPDTAAGSRSKARAAAATKPRPKPRPAPRTGHETIDTKTPAGKARARKILAEEAR